jgi:hypothetical protein
MANKNENRQEKAAPRVVWDDSQLKTAYANVCNVTSTREEVSLFFGTNQTWNTAQGEFRVALSDRIILNPFAAKRLSLLLSNVLKEYESLFGEIQITGGPAPSATPGGTGDDSKK